MNNDSLDSYLSKFNKIHDINDEILDLEGKLNEINNLYDLIEHFKYLKFKNVHVIIKREINPTLEIGDDKYNFRSNISLLFREIFKNRFSRNIPLKIMVYKIYLHRKELEDKLKNIVESISKFENEYNINNLEAFIFNIIEKLLEKQIALLEKK